MRLRLATRGSALAWTQSGHVADALRARGHEVELVKVVTHGDVSTAPLAGLGGVGVFVGAVRAAVLAGDADLAVHSFKDLPTAAADGLLLAAVPPREDASDALCARDGLTLATLPRGARVGTGSPRRAAQLLALRPDLEVLAIRGNVETRLRRVHEDLDAVVLAAAGLRRLGLQAAITQLFGFTDMLPAPAQGALAVECRTDALEVVAALAPLDDPATRFAAVAERAVLARLEAGCAAPVAAHATVEDGRLTLVATVVAVDGSRRLLERGEAEVSPEAAEELGRRVAGRLLDAGAAGVADLGAARPRPLDGRTVLVPRRAPRGTADALRAAGADVVVAAFTTIVDLPREPLEAALEESWDWVVVSSAHTVDALAAGPALAGARVAAVGPATADALRAAGIEPDLVADPGGGAALVEAFSDGPGRVLLPGAQEPSAEPAAGLAARGWTVRPVGVYATVAEPLPDDVVRGWRDGRFSAFVVTAGSVARAAVDACGLPGPGVVALGASAAAVATACGLDVRAVAARPEASALVEAVLAALGDPS